MISKNIWHSDLVSRLLSHFYNHAVSRQFRAWEMQETRNLWIDCWTHIWSKNPSLNHREHRQHQKIENTIIETAFSLVLGWVGSQSSWVGFWVGGCLIQGGFWVGLGHSSCVTALNLILHWPRQTRSHLQMAWMGTRGLLFTSFLHWWLAVWVHRRGGSTSLLHWFASFWPFCFHWFSCFHWFWAKRDQLRRIQVGREVQPEAKSPRGKTPTFEHRYQSHHFVHQWGLQKCSSYMFRRFDLAGWVVILVVY